MAWSQAGWLPPTLPPLEQSAPAPREGGEWEAFPLRAPTWPAAASLARLGFAAAADAAPAAANADAAVLAAWEVWNLRFSCSSRRIAVAAVVSSCFRAFLGSVNE